MAHPFIGRKHELELLNKLLKKRVASLVVIKGRRRIGKSRLVEMFGSKHTFFRFSGLPPGATTINQSQLNEFARQMSMQMGIPEILVDDWSKLFYLLAEQVKTGRVVLLFDEISWMGSKDHDFLGKLKNAWDLYFKKNSQLILVLCGSVSSWINKNILSSTGFVGRISLRLTIKELPLQDCNKFWSQNHYISAYEKLKMLAVTGGIPRYLEEINPSLCADENIKDLCFTSGGLLVNEFNDVFSDLFSHRGPLYKRILTILSQGPAEAHVIANKLQLTYSGSTLVYLDDLQQAGFISRDYTWHFSSGRISKLSQFRLSDNYVRFYLKYVDPLRAKIENRSFDFKVLCSLPEWETVMGYQFENLVLRNRNLIREALSLKPDDYVTDNPFFQRKAKRLPGCQIDYLIQTKFRGLYACEIKFSKNPVGSSVITEVKQKIKNMAYPKGFSVWPVLIHVNGIQPEIVQSNFFSHIIDFGDLLTQPSQTEVLPSYQKSQQESQKNL